MSWFGENPDTARLLISLMIGVAVFCLAVVAILLRGRRSPAWRRVTELQGHQQRAQQASMLQGLRESITGLLTRLAGPAKPKDGWKTSKLRNDLIQAGYRTPAAINIYLGLRMVSIVLLPAITIVSPLSSRLQGTWLPLFLVLAAGLGYVLPSYILETRCRSRRKKISRELPDVLDLLVICVEAGLGLDAAIKRVATEVAISAPLLSTELTVVSLELKAGIPRDMALKNLSLRCGVDDVTSLVAMLNQADRFGVSVGRSLRVHSDTVRTKRRQAMEEAAAKVPLKLLFPVLFMIFPAIMVVMGGPALIKISESILK